MTYKEILDRADYNLSLKKNPYLDFTIQYDYDQAEFWARENFEELNNEVSAKTLQGLKSKIRAYRRNRPRSRIPYYEPCYSA